jgi:hypothetical protein
MSKRRYELDTRVLTVFFFVAIPFVAFGALVVIHMARVSLQRAMGESLEQRALETKQLVERYVADQFVHLRHVSINPAVRAAFSAPPLAKLEEREKHDHAWTSGDASLMAGVIGNPAAAALRQATQVHPAYKLIQIVDGQGRLVASNVRGGRLFNDDTPWFRSVASTDVANDQWVGDIQRPAHSPTFLLELAIPVRDPQDGRLLGAVRALVDVYDLYNGILAPVRLGRTGHAELIRSTDGLILASDTNDSVLRDRFAGFQYIEVARGERRGYWLAPELGGGAAGTTEPRRVVGYSPVDRVPNVQWMVVVEQELSEAIAPLEGITWYLWIHFVGVFGVAILLAFYFSFKLEAPVIEEELHLHEQHVPSSMRGAEV